jgi:Flp pilus assembly protein CpaB
LKPGDHVDVLATFDMGSGQTVTTTVLQNVTLLAVGSQVLPSHPSENTGLLPGSSSSAGAPQTGATPAPQPTTNATLMVTPAQAEALVLTAARGKIQLALRPPDDGVILNVPRQFMSSVTGPAPRAPQQQVAHISAPRSALSLPALPVFSAQMRRNSVPPPPDSTITVIRGPQLSNVSVANVEGEAPAR